MLHRRPTAIAGLLLALAPVAATLSSCGFDYPTDRVNTVAAGVNDRDHSVDALGIRILASADGEGRLIGSLVNNLDETASLQDVTSPDQSVTAELRPIRVPGRGMVNLADPDKVIRLSGSFAAGEHVLLELSFSTEESFTLDVPVVKPCYQYTQIPSPSTEESSAPAGGEASEESAAHAQESEAHAEESQAEESHGEESQAEEHGEEHGDATYTCADEIPTPGGGGGH